MESFGERSPQHAIALISIIVAGAAAALTGVADTRAALAAATVVEVVLIYTLWVLAVAERDRVLDLIVEGRENLTVRSVARERRRLLDPRHRARLSHSLAALRHEAERPVLRPPSTRPLCRRRVIAAASRDLLETARALRCEHAGAAGVAMAERLLSRHDSPLYGENAERLCVELRRCRFLLADGPATVDCISQSSPRRARNAVPGRDPRPGSEYVSASPERRARP